ncbi:DUF2922 domain-containing protein [Lactobacillus xylocopicola]|uniref:DUF2922 domain-containing protein n=1 Tax=Lactobacillus xylocopicola TaxID=2976676 RepID=A0ABN6SL56_9LACO|nr:DUF2922 domain-containing protein [Lactobacillus xylocopicola]BDR61103.1 hypothetical protein KIM322_13640 [Lactobacillus xylocopicola]
MTTSRTLQLVFLTGAAKKAKLAVPEASANLNKATVKTAMETIAQANAFAKDGVDLYKIPQSAAYIERTVTSVFDDTAA